MEVLGFHVTLPCRRRHQYMRAEVVSFVRVVDILVSLPDSAPGCELYMLYSWDGVGEGFCNSKGSSLHL